MALTFTSAMRSILADAAVDRLDLGSTDLNGDIKWYTATSTLLATSQLSNPAAGAAAAGVATFNAISQAVVSGSANPSNLSYAAFCDRDNVELFRGTVGVTGAELNGPFIAVNDGDTIDVTNLTYTQP